MRYGPRMYRQDLFYCKGGVNVVKPLQLTRRSLLKLGRRCGGNVLLDEK
jgi:hypothetical protein